MVGPSRYGRAGRQQRVAGVPQPVPGSSSARLRAASGLVRCTNLCLAHRLLHLPQAQPRLPPRSQVSGRVLNAHSGDELVLQQTLGRDSRTHNGVDYACAEGSAVSALLRQGD